MTNFALQNALIKTVLVKIFKTVVTINELPTMVYWVLNTQKCFDTRKESVEIRIEAECFSNILLRVSKHL